ncbi:hypothetical protein [Rhizobium phaseoli]|uniref:hypothetical protein n=1 Tax=Rhizobium phaseoli TaxID=396 RepID=UPI0011AEC316|nr:hypothetical protein [Rhizobium phaseoli]
MPGQNASSLGKGSSLRRLFINMFENKSIIADPTATDDQRNHAYNSLLPIVVIGTFTSSLPLYTVSQQCSKRSWIAGGFELRPLIVVEMILDDTACTSEQQFHCRTIILQLKSMHYA